MGLPIFIKVMSNKQTSTLYLPWNTLPDNNKNQDHRVPFKCTPLYCELKYYIVKNL